MKIKFEKVQQAFIDGVIDIDQFIDILIDNFGVLKTRRILEHNIKLAMEKECKNSSRSETES